MKKIKMSMIGLFIVLILAACNNAASEPKPNQQGVATDVDPEVLINKSCITCHGEQLEGQGMAPSLNNVADRLTKDEIIDAIENGRTGMPILYRGIDAEAIAGWLIENSQ